MLGDFINREYEYYYAPSYARALFTLAEREDFIRNSALTISEYIERNNLEYKYRKLNIRNTFSYKQEGAFRRSGLTLDEFVAKHGLCINPADFTNTEDIDHDIDIDNEIDNDIDIDYGDDGDDGDNDGDGWGN